MSTVCSLGCSAAMKAHLLNLDGSALSLFTQRDLTTCCQFFHPYILWKHFLQMAGHSFFHNLGKAMSGLQIQSQTFLYNSRADIFWIVQSWTRFWHIRNTTVFYPIIQLHDYGHRYLSTLRSLFPAWSKEIEPCIILCEACKKADGEFTEKLKHLWILLMLHDQPGAEGNTAQSSTNCS